MTPLNRNRNLNLGLFLLLLAALFTSCATNPNQPPRQIILLCPIEGSYLISDVDPPKFEHLTIDGKDTTPIAQRPNLLPNASVFPSGEKAIFVIF